jgi:hypothetical protein
MKDIITFDSDKTEIGLFFRSPFQRREFEVYSLETIKAEDVKIIDSNYEYILNA